jgi:hypothetical protein
MVSPWEEKQPGFGDIQCENHHDVVAYKAEVEIFAP